MADGCERCEELEEALGSAESELIDAGVDLKEAREERDALQEKLDDLVRDAEDTVVKIENAVRAATR